IVNVHPSLLPLYRGPSPIQSAILNGDTTTGVSLILLDAEVDHGPILVQTEQIINLEDDAVSLSNKLAEQSVKMLVESLPKYLSGELKPIPQNHSAATFTKIINKADGQADFINKTAEELNNQRRAFTPWPGLWTMWQGKRLKLLSTVPHNAVTTKPGLVTLVEDSLVIGTKSGALQINELQLEGGKPLKTKDFLLGHKSFINSLL
ncbi:MAG: methionyl-tRNA formyltransferase, partial [Patescibacteria group bacterium]